MDKNDLIRKKNALIEQRKSVNVERAEFLRKTASKMEDEKRSRSADEAKKEEDYAAAIETIDVKVRALDAEIASLEVLDPETRSEASDGNQDSEETETRTETRGAFFDTEEYEERFSMWARGQINNRALGESIIKATSLSIEARAFGRDAATKGAPVVPRSFLAELVKLLPETHQLVGELPVKILDGDKEYVTETGKGSAAYRDPGDAYAEDDPTLANANITIHDIGRLLKVDEELLDDMQINLIPYFAENFSECFGELMGAQAILGTGNDAKGPASIVSGATNFTTAATGVIAYDDIVDLRATPAVSARRGAKWLFNGTTEAALLKLKDGDDRPLWNPSMREGEPGVILGQTYLLADDVADPDAGNVAMYYGPWARYCTNYVRRNMTLRRLNELFAATGQVGFRGQLRHDLVNKQPTAFAKMTVKA